MQTQPRRANPKAALFAMTAGGLLAISNLAQAHYFCVTTAQQFQNALDQSSDGGAYNGEDNDIYMVNGIYVTGAATSNGPFYFYSSNSAHAIGIYGGYKAGCSAPGPSTPATKLDGGGNTGVMTIRNKLGNVFVRNVTVQNGESSQPGAGLQVNYLIPVNGDVDIYNLIIRDNHSGASGGGLYVSAAGERLFLLANLITGNSADGQYGAGYVTGHGAFNQIVNNTVTKNTSPTVGGLYCGGTTRCQVFNSIFWSNTGYGLYFGGDFAVLAYNDYGTLGGIAPSVDLANLSVQPRFIDFANNDFHLARDSPLLGYGEEFGSIVDLDGNPFPSTGKLDLGAYSETIFVDGVDDD